MQRGLTLSWCYCILWVWCWWRRNWLVVNCKSVTGMILCSIVAWWCGIQLSLTWTANRAIWLVLYFAYAHWCFLLTVAILIAAPHHSTALKVHPLLRCVWSLVWLGHGTLLGKGRCRCKAAIYDRYHYLAMQFMQWTSFCNIWMLPLPILKHDTKARRWRLGSEVSRCGRLAGMYWKGGCKQWKTKMNDDGVGERESMMTL